MTTLKNEKLIPNLTLSISIGLYVLSLTQKCYCTENICADSFMVAISGWAGLLYGGAVLTWLANPLLFTSWLLTSKKIRLSILLSIISSSVSLSFLFFETIRGSEIEKYTKIISYELGYWLWLASSATMFIGNMLRLIITPIKTNTI